MKIFTNKNVVQKITIAILIVLSVSFIAPKCVKADNGDAGGALFEPISDFLFWTGKSVMKILQDNLYVDERGEKVSAFVDGSDISWGVINIGIVQSFIEGDGNTDELVKLRAKQLLNTPVIGDLYKNYLENTATAFEGTAMGDLSKEMLEAGIAIPNIQYTPAKIIAGKLPIFDINFINPTSIKDEEGEEKSTAAILQNTIATWYIIIRNIAIIGLLLVLIYVGIKIIISSTAAENAKYKKMIIDWLVALCLIFVLHYIMSFAINITQTITEAVSDKVISEDGDQLMNSIVMKVQMAKVEGLEDVETGERVGAILKLSKLGLLWRKYNY